MVPGGNSSKEGRMKRMKINLMHNYLSFVKIEQHIKTISSGEKRREKKKGEKSS